MSLTKGQWERVHQIAAWATGQCTQSPESMMTTDEKNNPEFVSEVGALVFYCEGCSWYCDADERHEGDLCDDCHDAEQEL